MLLSRQKITGCLKSHASPTPVPMRCLVQLRKQEAVAVCRHTGHQHRRSGPLSSAAAEAETLTPDEALSSADASSEEETEEHAPSALNNNNAIMLQAFGWDSCTKKEWYNQLKAKIPGMKAVGTTHVWLPPPSQSVSAQGYLPGQLYNLSSKYGNEEELKSLNAALKEAGIVSICDIVINHRCADEQVDGVWNKFRDDQDHQGRKIDWGKWAITSDDPLFQGSGNPDTGEDYGPAPDLDHLNDNLRTALKDWMTCLKDDIGFGAWRFDFVKGYGARFIKEYVDATVGAQALNVGELWSDLKWNGADLDMNQDEARKKLVKWIDDNGATAAAFDFTTKGVLQEAAKNTQYNRLVDRRGRAPGLLGLWPGKAVTFVDNHDTGSTQQHWPFPSKEISVGYAYILTHPGIPCLFWDHVETWGDGVRTMIIELVKLRKRNGINAESKLKILCAEGDMYVATIDDKITVKLGPRYDMGKYHPSKDAGWVKAASGHNFAVWEKGTAAAAAPPPLAAAAPAAP